MKSKKPFYKVNVEISNICNLQCSFCPPVIRAKKMMDLNLFKNIIEQISPLTDQVCLHLMGEPLTHPNLGEMIEICHQYDARIFLVSNGLLLREKHTELLLHPTIRQVNFSLHSFPDNFGDKDPTLYLERIFLFTERAFKERPDLYINYRLWNLTDTKGTGPQNQDLLRRVEEHFNLHLNSDIDLRKKKSRHLTNRLYLHFDTEFIWPSLDLPILGQRGTCYGLSNHFGILADGTVVPCCLDKEGVIPLGKVSEKSITDILSSERALNILNGFKRGILNEELCKRCQYIERFGSF